MPTPDALSNPLYWLAALGILFVLFLLAGKRNRYQPYHYDMARDQGRELPRNQTRRITGNDALQIPLAALTIGAVITGAMIEAPQLFVLAAMFACALGMSFWRTYAEYVDEAARDGIKLQQANGGAGGFSCLMLFMVVGVAMAAGVLLWLIL